MEEAERRLQASVLEGVRLQLTTRPSGTWTTSICSPGVWPKTPLLDQPWAPPSSASWGGSSRGFLMETGAVKKYCSLESDIVKK